MKNNSHNPMK